MYCSVEDIKRAVDFPNNGAPIDDNAIEEFILDAQAEIENIYNTKFGSIEDSGTANSGSSTGLVDTDKDWCTDKFVGDVLWVYGGTGSGQYREIQSNTGTAIVISPVWTTNPASDSTYRIVKLGYKDQTVDGSGTDSQFTEYQPLINLNAVTIDSTSVNTGSVYVYNDMSKLKLSNNASKSSFENNQPQLVNLKYVYGVYPLPRPIKRLCICIAAIKTLVSQISGTYDDFTTVSLPGGVSASKGEPYQNIKSALASLQNEAKGIVYGDAGNQLESNFNKVPVYRPFSSWG